MAQVTVTLFTDPGTGLNPNTGSAMAVSANTPVTFNEQSPTGWVGRLGKNNPEANLFLRFRRINADVPIGSIIDGANIRLTTNAAATSGGNLRIGHLITSFDSNRKAGRNGWAFDNTAPFDPDSFSKSYDYTTTINAPAHSTNNNVLTILLGRLLFNIWLSTNFTWLGIGATTQIHWGDGIGGEDQIVDSLIFSVSITVNDLTEDPFLFTIDSQAVSNADDRLKVHLDPTALDSNKPALIVKYTENFPEFTSVPTAGDLSADATCLYEIDIDAIPYLLPDQTRGAFLRLRFSLTTFPAGMTIIDVETGEIEWTPTVAQAGASYSVVMRVQNDGDLFAETDLSWSITVPTIGSPSFITSPPLTGEEEKLYVYDADAVPGTAACQDQTVTFSLIVGPPGMVMDPVTGVLSWTPGLGDAGNHDVTIRVVNFIPSNTTDQSFIIFIHVQQPDDLADPTLTGIANCALVSLGERRIRSLDDTTLGAQLIRDRFDDVRDELIRLFPWDFAKTRARLPANATPPIGDFAGFTYAYPLPFDFVRLIEVLTPAHHAYRVEGGQILTHNEAPLEIVYLRSVTNPGEMDVLFRETLCASLAFEIAAAITDNSDKIAAAATRFLAKLRDARRASGQEEEPEDQGGEFGGWLEFRGSDKRREDR